MYTTLNKSNHTNQSETSKMASSSSLSVDFTPQKTISSGRGNHSEQVDDISQSIKFELQGREFELPVDQLCSLLNIPAISPLESSWPRNLFGETKKDEPYHQREAMRLLNHLWGAETHGFTSVGGKVFLNAGIGKRSAEKPDIVLYQNPETEFIWANVLVTGEVKTNKPDGHPQICRYLRKLHQNRPGGSDYVGFLVAGCTLSVYISNAAGVLKTTPIDLSVGKDSLPALLDCIRIFRHAEHLSVQPFEGYLEYPGHPQFYRFKNLELLFVKETMQGSRTAVWTGSLEGDTNPVIFKTCWLPASLVNHERELVDLLSAQQPWGIIPFVHSGVRLVNGAREATPSVSQELIRYREISISLDNGYRAFEKQVKTFQEWISILAGISDTARILFLVWSKCQIHHRDISTGNIVFSPYSPSNMVEFLSTRSTDIGTEPKRRSMSCLIDWANGRRHSTQRGGQPVESPLNDAISGTRPFLSIKMLDISAQQSQAQSQAEQLRQESGLCFDKEQMHHLPIDDLESLYWVLLWFAAEGNGNALQSWRCSDGGVYQKQALLTKHGKSKDNLLEKFMGKWDDESRPLFKIIFFLLFDLSKTITKLGHAFGRKGELEIHPTHPDYEDNLAKADTKWAPLFTEFVQRLDEAVLELNSVNQQ